MKYYYKNIAVWFIVLLSVSGCSVQDETPRISFDALFESMVSTDFDFNLSVKGSEELNKILSDGESRILDYLIIKTDDPIISELFVFLEFEPSDKQDVVESMSQYLAAWRIENDIVDEEYQESPLVFESGSILIYIYSRNSDKYKSIIIESFK